MPTHEANLKGTTSKMIEVKAFDATTGQGATGKVYTDFTCYYVREGASAATAVTLVTATLGTFTSGGLKEISAANAKGVYQFGVPNAAIAAGAGDKVTFYFECTGCIIPPQIVPLVAYNPQLAYITPGTGTGQLDVSGGRAPADVVYFGGVAGTFSGGIPEVNVIKFAGTPNGDLAGGVQDGLNAQGYLSARATLLDNLDGAISDVLAAITGLNNLSALANLYGSPLLEIPDSSSTLFAFTLVVRDNEGKLVDLDASPTIAAANAAGTSRSANLSAVSHPATGRYTFTYSVSSAAAEESLRITCSGTVSAEGRYVEWIGAVVNYDTLTTLAAAAASAATAATQATAAAASAASADAKLSVGRLGKLDSLAFTTANQLDVRVLTNSDKTGYSLSASQTFSTTGAVGSITGVDFTNLLSMGARWLGMVALSAGLYRYTAAALALAPAGGGGGGTTENIVVEFTEVRA